MENTVKDVALGKISISKFNPRRHFDPKKMQELKDSIKDKGVIQPILVRPSNGKFEIVCGERRYKASQLAGAKEIPVIVKQLSDQQVLEIQVIENLQREDLHPLEEAEGYEALIKKHGYSAAEDIAAKIGKSKSYVYGRLKLCDLIPENRKLFYEQKISSSVALLLARVPAHLQKEAGKAIIENDEYGYENKDQPMTYHQAKDHIEEYFMLQMKEAQFNTKEKGLARKVSCVECPKRTGNQKELFADIQGADRCTDPACFKAKKQAFTQRTLTKLRAEKKEVVPQDEAERLFQYSSDTPRHKYMALDERHYDWPSGVTVRKMLKACPEVKTVHALHPESGKLIEMVSRMDLPKLIKKAGIKTDQPANASESMVKHKKEERVRAARRAFWVEKISKNMDQRVKNAILLDILLRDLQFRFEDDKLLDDAPMEGEIDDIYDLGNAQVQKLIERAIFTKPNDLDDGNLEFLATKLGFNVSKEFVISESYLQALTKDQLITLAGKIGLTKWLEQKKICDRLGDKKKTELIDLFLKKGFKLEGRVPKEIIKDK